MVRLLVEARKQKFKGNQGSHVEVEVERAIFKVMVKGPGVVDSGKQDCSEVIGIQGVGN